MVIGHRGCSRYPENTLKALDLVHSYGKVLDVEVKNPVDFRRAGDAVVAFGYAGAFVSSFWHAGIAQFKGSFPSIRTAYIYAHEPWDLAAYAAEVDFLKPYRGYFTDEMYRPYLSKALTCPSSSRRNYTVLPS